MSASGYGLNSHLSPLDQLCIVKVSNLNKATTREDIETILSHWNIHDIQLIHCKTQKVNYAFIYLLGYDKAKKLADAIHNHRVEIHGNILMAIVRENTLCTLGGKLIQKVDKTLVEILFYNSEVPLAGLKKYFLNYGEVESVTIAKLGSPSVCHINYSTALSAYVARNESPHCIDDTTAVALPIPEPLESQKQFKMESFPCDLVVIETVKGRIMEKYCLSWVKFLIEGNIIKAYFPAEMSSTIHGEVHHVIKQAESEIVEMPLKAHFSCLPILASTKTKKSIADIKPPCELKVRQSTTYVPLDDLILAYQRSCNLLGNSLIAPYMYLNKVSSQWYWQDDKCIFQKFTKDMEEKLEISFTPTTTTATLEIQKNSFTVDFMNMTLTCLMTGHSWRIKRDKIQTFEDWEVALQLRAHQSYVEDCKKQIDTIVTSCITKANLKVPSLALQTDSFQGTLKLMRKSYITITSEGDGGTMLLIKGKDSLVQEAQLKLQNQILQILAEKSFHMTIPITWEKQSSQCELKPVMRGTPEWRNIEDKILQLNFMVRIEKIERIQNEWLWELYQLSKKRMSQKNDGKVNEKVLFHGTRQTPPKDIYHSEQGFDNRLASKGLWGEGTYFAESAQYSNDYAYNLGNGYKQIFAVDVLIGIACQLSSEDRSLKAPPLKKDNASLHLHRCTSKFAGERFDSVIGTRNNSQIYVIYELGRAYPSYLITYRL